MAFEKEQRDALSLLQSIENGTLQGVEAGYRLDETDPALVYFIFTWIRHRYGNDHPAAAGVIGRLVEITNGRNTVKAKMREGKSDFIVQWFEEEHRYKDFDAREFIALIVEKLEG